MSGGLVLSENRCRRTYMYACVWVFLQRNEEESESTVVCTRTHVSHGCAERPSHTTGEATSLPDALLSRAPLSIIAMIGLSVHRSRERTLMARRCQRSFFFPLLPYVPCSGDDDVQRREQSHASARVHTPTQTCTCAAVRQLCSGAQTNEQERREAERQAPQDSRPRKNGGRREKRCVRQRAAGSGECARKKKKAEE